MFYFFDYAALKRNIVRSSLHLQNCVDYLLECCVHRRKNRLHSVHCHTYTVIHSNSYEMLSQILKFIE